MENGSFGSGATPAITSECIKWSQVVVNMDPENFRLSEQEDDCGALIISNAGVYEISFTLFVPQISTSQQFSSKSMENLC